MRIIIDQGADVHIVDNNTVEITTPRRQSIAVINKSTVLTDAEVKLAMPNFQKAVNEDFEPLWNIGCNLNFGNPLPGQWWIAILDNTDQADALAYHDLTPEGLPISKVFAKTELDAGASWTVALTHELFEMLADPEIVRAGQDSATGIFYAWETGDPVEADNLGYLKGNTLISDFILPAYFEHASNNRWDFQRKLTAPFSLAAGGYIAYWDSATSQWVIKLAAATPVPIPKGSRRERRTRSKYLWARSNPRAL